MDSGLGEAAWIETAFGTWPTSSFNPKFFNYKERARMGELLEGVFESNSWFVT